MRKVTIVIVAALLALALGAGGCQRAEDRYLKRRVERNELVGRWVMTAASVKDLADVGYATPVDSQQHTITLSEDGTCHFHTFASALTADGRASSPVARQCQWSIRDIVGRQTLLLDLLGDPSFVVRYNFGEHHGALSLWQHADDPDAWRYIEYVKQ